MGPTAPLPYYRTDHWPPERLRAVATAWREATTRCMDPAQVREAAILAHMEHGGTRDQAERELMLMITTLQRDHGAWLNRPLQEQMGRQEAALRTLGWWPPPRRMDKSRVWAEVALERLSAPPPDEAEVARRLAARAAENRAWLEARRAQVFGPSIASISPEEPTPQRS